MQDVGWCWVGKYVRFADGVMVDIEKKIDRFDASRGFLRLTYTYVLMSHESCHVCTSLHIHIQISRIRNKKFTEHLAQYIQIRYLELSIVQYSTIVELKQICEDNQITKNDVIRYLCILYIV